MSGQSICFCRRTVTLTLLKLSRSSDPILSMLHATILVLFISFKAGPFHQSLIVSSIYWALLSKIPQY